MIRVAAGRGLRASRWDNRLDEDDVVSSDAVPGPAGQLQHKAPQRVGRHRSGVVRSRRHGGDIRHLHRSARLRRGLWFRRDLRQRAPQQWLRVDAISQPHRRHPRQPHIADCDHGSGQLGRALQPAAARRRGVRHAGPVLTGQVDCRLPGWHGNGYHPLVQHESGHASAALLRRHRADHEGLAIDRAVRVQRPVQPAAVRQPGAAPMAKAAPTGVDPRRRFRRDMGLLRGERLRLRRPHLLRLQDGDRDGQRILEQSRSPRPRRQPAPARSHAIHRRCRHRCRGVQAVSRAC